MRVTTLGVVVGALVVGMTAMHLYSWWSVRRERERDRRILSVALDGLDEAPRVVLAAHPEWKAIAAKAFDRGETIVVVALDPVRNVEKQVELQRVGPRYVIVAERDATPERTLAVLRCPDVSREPPPDAATERPRVARAARVVQQAFPRARTTVVDVEEDGRLVVVLAEGQGERAWLVQTAYADGRYLEVHRETMTDEYLRSRVKRAPRETPEPPGADRHEP